ncbi:MAG: HAD family hydrolase [Clostridia bacterium]|nr:HAD family hydrolase [Clostridia bacterium]
MKEYKYVLFDLDGTLTDPAVGITTSVAYALKKFGIEVNDITTLNHFIGPPLLDTFMEDYGFSKEKAQTAIDYYRERFRVKGLYENVVYDGVPEMLEKLKKGGKEIILATSKPEPFAREILRHFGLDKYFLFIAGSNFDGTRTAKAEVIEYALESAGVSDKTAAVMVGDRKHDIIGAQKTGLDSIGVLYGYGSKEEISGADATHIAETVEDIVKLIMG